MTFLRNGNSVYIQRLLYFVLKEIGSRLSITVKGFHLENNILRTYTHAIFSFCSLYTVHTEVVGAFYKKTLEFIYYFPSTILLKR